ncbi:MAG: hypothetical protein WCF85_11260 [Rhodospirillaceae bacterium]
MIYSRISKRIPIPIQDAASLYDYIQVYDYNYLETSEALAYKMLLPKFGMVHPLDVFLDRKVETATVDISGVEVVIHKFMFETLEHGYFDQYRLIVRYGSRMPQHYITLEARIDERTFARRGPVHGLLETMDDEWVDALNALIARACGYRDGDEPIL